MPELPEVETTLRGIAPHVSGLEIVEITVRNPHLRWPITPEVQLAVGQSVQQISRRAKYLLIETQRGTLVLHLGMSGSLTVQPAGKPAAKHDHLDIVLANGHCLRLNDPRRFGACLWQGAGDPVIPQLRGFGPEPLATDFNGQYLFQKSRGRSLAVKNFIMCNQVVVGVGNIYASEALFASGIRPDRPAGSISNKRYDRLANQIKAVLHRAIQKGGTTLRDFLGADGKPGYFRIELNVYDRAGQPCPRCQHPLKSMRIGQRNSFYCVKCQS